ncbi:peptidylprolyl isomerase [Streptomyces adelaidensis]|uniref:peptidylprolyl isomerase n=1 Tax=Streptomyces adelaidensis TaxID=2796465 RepID=UPI001902E359|nr:peptidylprolyl isomerase [Streptomyces adelaidensis]
MTWASLSLTAENSPSDAKPSPACSYTPTDRGKPADIPAFDAEKAVRPYRATLITNRGRVLLDVLSAEAPCTANSFAFLAGKGHFDRSECHRLTSEDVFTLECGDSARDGGTDPGYFFRDENLDDATYPAGTVAMSKVVPGRNGSRFFISYADPEVAMRPHWTPFAKVVGGLDIVREIARRGTADGSADGRPKKSVVIESVIIQRAEAAAPAPAPSS